MFTQVKLALIYFSIYTIVLGLVYPLLTTLVGGALFPSQANGSLLSLEGRVLGSSLVGQQFTSERYFWGRPSATSPTPYNGESSCGSNLAISNPTFTKNLADSADKHNASKTEPAPIELVSASGSGLDPDISVAAAIFQLKRVARARGVSENTLRAIVQSKTAERTLGILGEPRVNLLALNIALDQLNGVARVK